MTLGLLTLPLSNQSVSLALTGATDSDPSTTEARPARSRRQTSRSASGVQFTLLDGDKRITTRSINRRMSRLKTRMRAEERGVAPLDGQFVLLISVNGQQTRFDEPRAVLPATTRLAQVLQQARQAGIGLSEIGPDAGAGFGAVGGATSFGSQAGITRLVPQDGNAGAAGFGSAGGAGAQPRAPGQSGLAGVTGAGGTGGRGGAPGQPGRVGQPGRFGGAGDHGAVGPQVQDRPPAPRRSINSNGPSAMRCGHKTQKAPDASPEHDRQAMGRKNRQSLPIILPM